VTANRSDLLFDVETVNVSGRVTLNGAPPTLVPTCTQQAYTYAQVSFVETSRGYRAVADVNCPDAQGSFAAQLYPGTYRVLVQGINRGSNLPQGSAYVAYDRLLIR
jgi:hypothetical protein